ncbi:FtsQ-type POTRA domain-containing protein [Pseudonocardia sp. RS11V-5]|uniref:cell division protein FtsQ/DivIB n=1 Tax=Pseudonocardia terrae TaxID=2905831 RepID=UPI001E5BC7EB|nr:FtsQ-type POTRA domain-containing protein [Pseudonocardia terrae]MCE3554971.1 FtsQ-type POTRA domain-containing protein [Pseudonocardia terrae]
MPARPAAAERARRIREERAAQRGRLLPQQQRAEEKRARRTAQRSAQVSARQARKARKAAVRAARPGDRRFRVRRRVALTLLVLVLLAALGVGSWLLLTRSGLADVETVEVTGTLTVSRDAVLDAAAVETGGPLAEVDTKAAAERVAQLPGVGSVQVSRGWPHTVEIAVVERTAVALARTPQGITLVDATGVAYQKAPEVPPALPMLGFGAVGPDDPSTRAALTVLQALPADLRGQVTTIDVDNAATEPTVRLGLGERQVLFGSTDRADRKVAVLVPLLTQEGSVYDVSSPELPTVTR